MTTINTPESGASTLTLGHVDTEPATPVDQQNLQRYANLVWRIHQRRLSGSIDRKSLDR